MNVIDKKSKSFDYKWVVVACSFLMVFTCLGFCSSNKSLYVAAITDALDISRSSFSIDNSIRFITTAVLNLFFGSLVQRFGTKKLICAGFLSLILSVLIYSAASNVYMFYVGGCLLGIGLAWTTTTMVGCVVNKWCKENKGTIMGAVLCANGFGGAFAAQIVSPIINEEGNPFGYRNAYRLIAVILLIVGLIIAVFMREQPKGYDNSQPVVSKKKHRGESWVGIEYGKLIKMKYFYVATACIFLTGFALQVVNGVAAVHMKDVGIDAPYIATVLSVHSIALAGFKFLTGFIYDRLGLRKTTIICSAAGILSMLSLILLTNTEQGRVFAMFYGIVSSLALPLETIMLPIYTGDLFGQKSFDKVLGIFTAVNTAGYAVGSPLTNLVFDITGSYVPAFIFGFAVLTAVLAVMQFVITSALRLRTKITETETV